MSIIESVVEAGQYNIGHICTRRQCELGLGDKVAMVWLAPEGARSEYTFRDLDRESGRLANALLSLGLKKGDIVFTYLPKMPEQFFVFLGTLKTEMMIGTLFSNFGDDALFDRLSDAKAKCIITKKSLLKKVLRVRDRLPHLRYICLIDWDEGAGSSILSYRELMDGASPDFTAAVTAPDTPSVIHYTSGSTGAPKGVIHCHGSIIHQSQTAEAVLKLRSDSRFWCTADQGWVTGTTYGIISPWSLGVTQIHYGGGYDASNWMNILEQEQVSVWYTAPTALRMLMQESAEVFSAIKFDALQHVFSVGEPLNPEIVHWGRRTFKRDICDTWFQTETGAIIIANKPGTEVRPGSMGKPLDGVEAAILNDDGTAAGPDVPGHLCIKPGWTSMFTTYLNNETIYRSKFRAGYYWTGDTALIDNEGYFWFLGRSDDVINTAGHLVSPFEVESALLELEEVAESGVVGVPDEILFEKVVAFVHLHKGYQWTKELELKVRLHVANKASSLATPQEIFIVDNIPKNKSGKILRRLLKARYMGTDAGDISTLEVPGNDFEDTGESYLQAGI